MSEFPPEPIEPRTPVPQPTPEQSEVLLRNRDVQALSRSFRRMSEVQEALLEHLDGIEESRSRRWVLPALALGSLVLGAGLATFGLLWYQQQQPQTPVEVRLDNPTEAPAITVESPEVTVQAPDNGINAELLEKLIDRMEQIGDTQEADRRLIAELSGRIVDGELGVMRMLQEMEQADAAEAAEAAAAENETAATPQPASAEGDAATAAPIPPDPVEAPVNEDEVWLGAMNGLIALGGNPEFRFRKGERVPDKAMLRDVLFLSWGQDGLIDSVVRADRVEFQLQQAAGTLEMRFFEGTRTRGASKTLLAGGGLRVTLREVDVRAWLDHFPELAAATPGLAAAETESEESGVQPAIVPEVGEAGEATPVESGESESAEEESAWDSEQVEAMREGVDALLSVERASGFYRLQRVTGVTDHELQGVRLAWYDSSGRLFQYVEADRLEIAPRGEGWLELRFHDGAFRRQDKLTPFQGGLYRLHLADQDLEAWRATGAPILDATP